MSGFGPKHDIPGDLVHVVFVLKVDLARGYYTFRHITIIWHTKPIPHYD